MTAVARPRRARTRSHLWVIVLLTVLAAWGIRFVPHAAAAAVAAREEVGDLIFEMTDDNMIGITFKKEKFRYEDNLDAAPKGSTYEKVTALLKEEQTVIRENYGWDLTNSADREGIQTELAALGQALHSFSDAEFDVEEFKPLLALRDLVDKLEGEAECRGRCLPEGDTELIDTIISAAAVGAAMSAITAEFANPDLPDEFLVYTLTSLAAAHTVLAFMIFRFAPAITGIRSFTLRTAALAAAHGALIAVHQYMSDARELANAKSTTPKEGAQKGAQEIAEISPSEVDTGSDYDMIHEGL